MVTAPNGAITNAEALKKLPEIMYLEPTTQKVAEGAWCIGGYSVANISVIEAEDGLIVYDTGDNSEEARHIREAIEKISDKPIKVIIYSHSHYALGGGELVDNPEDVMVSGHPTVNDTVQVNLRGGGAPPVYGEIGPVLTARAVVQMNNFLPEEGPDARLGGVIPFGLPATEAIYPPVATKDGQPMNAQHDYVIRMTKDQLPPSKAFWSMTLYDSANGFFIPNDRKKYSVGENGGMKLNADGGIEVYVAAEKPESVPEENWLPINRKDENLDVILRIYMPDLDKYKIWTPPKAEKLNP